MVHKSMLQQNFTITPTVAHEYGLSCCNLGDHKMQNVTITPTVTHAFAKPYINEDVGGVEIGWECFFVLLQFGRPQAARHAILTNFQKSHLLGRCTLHAANTSLYSAFANSCPPKTDTFLFPLIHSHNVILSSNKF